VRKKLIMRPRADFDLMRHYLYLAEHIPNKAEPFRTAVRAATKQIATHPGRGTVIAHPAFTGVELRFVRPIGFAKHLIIYQVADDCCVVLRILHGSQNFETELRPQ
jgi:plasmid stabilization system protein ParE